VGYKMTDRFLRDLTVLDVGDDISLVLLSCYFKTFYGVEEMPVYIDGHFKAVWTLKNILRGKHGMMDRVMPGLEQIFLNGQRALIPLEVDRDLNWISRKSFNVSLIRECQGW